MTVLAAAYGMGYVIAGWAIVLLGGAGYAASVVVRGRRVARQVPEGRRRWSESP